MDKPQSPMAQQIAQAETTFEQPGTGNDAPESVTAAPSPAGYLVLVGVGTVHSSGMVVTTHHVQPSSLGRFSMANERDITTERDTTMHATSELREWFLEWLDGDNGRFDSAALANLKELRSCTDELPAGYCQHGRLHLPFGVSYGVAARKVLGKKN